jgi:hypothetical protein
MTGRYRQGDWLFLGQGSNRLTDQLTGVLQVPPHILDDMLRIYRTRHERLATMGTPYVMLVAPEKQCVYPEHLSSLRLADNRVVNQILAHLAAHGLPTVYPVEALKRAKPACDIYFREDTHWTFPGAYIAYRALMAEVTRRLPCPVVEPARALFYAGAPRHELQRFDTLSPHDLANKIEPDYMGEPHRVRILDRRARMIEDNRVINIGHKAVFEQDAPHLPSAVLVRDSYADLMLPFLAESFCRLVAIWQPTLDWGLIEREKPDIVISQQAERFMVHRQDDAQSRSNQDHAAAKRAAGKLTPDPEPARPGYRPPDFCCQDEPAPL